MLIPFETVVKRCRPITGILHVGAHLAEELGAYEQFGVPQVVWVEADPRKAEYLEKAVCRPPRHRVICCAAMNEDRPAILHVTSNDGMSSSLFPLKLHQKLYPNVVEAQQIVVTGRRLGPYLKELGIEIGSPGFNFLNMDIQGAELEALMGLGEAVWKFDAIYLEVNTVALYEGLALLPEVDDFLRTFHFIRTETHMSGADHWGDALYLHYGDA